MPSAPNEMNLKTKFLMLVAAFFLSACVLAPQPHVNETGYVITQLTASTWTLATSGTRRLLPSTSTAKAALLDAIEKHSGCKVTDSDYASQGSQLDAQVDCANRFKK